MRIHGDQLGIRMGGSALGIGYCLLGAYALLGGDDSLDAFVRQRAFWFGITFVIAGLCAFGVSWLVGDLSDIWCRRPRRPGGNEP